MGTDLGAIRLPAVRTARAVKETGLETDSKGLYLDAMVIPMDQAAPMAIVRAIVRRAIVLPVTVEQSIRSPIPDSIVDRCAAPI